MTIKNLEQYRQLKNEIVQISQRLERLHNNKYAVASDTVKGSSHIFPYAERVVTITGFDEKHAAQSNKLKGRLTERFNRLQNVILEIEEFIDTVDRSEIRQIIDYRYVQGLSWLVTARKVYGYPCGDRARKVVTRFFAEI